MTSEHSVTAVFLAPLLDLRDGAPINPFGAAYYIQAYSGDQHREEYRN